LEKAQSEDAIKKLAGDTRAYLCIDCGKCTGTCPIGRVGVIYSPRAVVEHVVVARREPREDELWRCLTCGLCQERCPSDVAYPEFVHSLRELAVGNGAEPQPTHGGTIRELMKIMAKENLRQNKMGWLPDWVEVIQDTKEKGKKKSKSKSKSKGKEEEKEAEPAGRDIYFVGCAPYFDVVFEDFKLDLVGTHTAGLELLRSSGVTPTVLADERCCGHDALWSGDVDLFKKLAEANVELFKKAGAKRIFVSCPEGFHTFTKEYPKYLGALGLEFVNTVAFLAGEMTDVIKGNGNIDVTYHDSCRMGRFSGIYDEPRKILELAEGVNLREMEFSRDNAPCCGSNLWINCDHISRRMQNNLLDEAKNTGSEIMLTACDKCRIHLACAQMEMGNVETKIKTDNILRFLHRKAVNKS
jgi:heterodisulfide reductase subunit D